MRRIARQFLCLTLLGDFFALSQSLALAQGFGGNGGNQQTDPTKHVRLENFVIVISPRGDKVASFNVQTKKTALIRLSEAADTRLQATPIVGPGVVAFYVQGGKITRIVACDTETGALIPQDLREPLDGKAMPVVGTDAAAYVIGRYAYAFSPKLKSWDVVELAAGHEEYASVGTGYATVLAPGHIYTFSNQTGKWDHIDIKKLFGSEDQ